MIVFETERLLLRSLTIDDTSELLKYYTKNRNFLKEWEPERVESFYTYESMKSLIESGTVSTETRTGLGLYIFKKNNNETILGYCGLSNIVYGAFLSCFLGYKLDSEEINKGYMTEGIKGVIELAFMEYGLHRIEANIIPRNIRSRRVVEKLGFKNEGRSEKYLKINGKWEDHVHYVLLNRKVE